MLSASITMKSLEVITRRNAQVVEFFRRIYDKKLGSCPALNLVWYCLHPVAGKERCRALRVPAKITEMIRLRMTGKALAAPESAAVIFAGTLIGEALDHKHHAYR